MIVYRLAKLKYARDLSGKGAELAGGRWNSKGTPMLYTCDSRALCTAEIAVHTPLGIIPENYQLVTINIPSSVKIREVNNLPKDWKSYPHSNSTQMIGDEFIRNGKNLILKVASAVVQGDFNYLINPHHKDFNKIKIISVESFEFDERLFN